jgi:hypothetical protein
MEINWNNKNNYLLRNKRQGGYEGYSSSSLAIESTKERKQFQIQQNNNNRNCGNCASRSINCPTG